MSEFEAQRVVWQASELLLSSHPEHAARLRALAARMVLSGSSALRLEEACDEIVLLTDTFLEDIRSLRTSILSQLEAEVVA